MGGPAVGSTHYFSAYGVVTRGLPTLKSVAPGRPSEDPPQVLDLMQRVTLIPSHSQTLFGPSVTIHLKDGRSFTRHATGREFIWNFDEEARRIRGAVPGIPIPADQFEDLIAACRDVDRLDQAARLIQLTL